MTPTERADDERPDPVLPEVFEEEGEGEEEEEDVDLEEVGVEGGSTIVDGPLGVEDVLGIKVAVGPFVLTLVLTLVLPRVDGTPEDGGLHLGVLEESRKHWYPDADGRKLNKVGRFEMKKVDLRQQKFSPGQRT